MRLIGSARAVTDTASVTVSASVTTRINVEIQSASFTHIETSAAVVTESTSFAGIEVTTANAALRTVIVTVTTIIT